MNTLNRTFHIARRTLALSAMLGAGLIAANAQQAVTPATTVAPTLNFQAPQVFTEAQEASFSSSSAQNQVAEAENPFDFLETANTQPPPRRSYGRPRYRGGNTNADGSNKWGFLVGAGLTAPVGDDSNYLKPSWGFQIGGGRNFNKNFGVMAQFDWDHFGFTGQTIANQANLYFADPTNQTGLDGNSHIWSLTLNPTYNIHSGEGIGAYVVVGGGFYHKAATFFVPTSVCDPFYGICYAANETVQNYSSNSAGVNGGFGLTYKTSHFSSARLYAEVRVVHTFNNYRPESTINPDGSVTGWNFFPQNSQEATYFPVKFGLRF
jgi:hypothetical protein